VKIAQYEHDDGCAIGFEVDGQWLDYTKAHAIFMILERGISVMPRNSIQQLLARGEFSDEGFNAVARFARKNRLQGLLKLPRSSVLKAPLPRPGKIIALGLNYALHAKEGSLGIPKEPIIFMKPGSSVIGPGETVRLPREIGRMDHEVELAVVIGKTATGVRKRKAWDVVAGFTICNDVTARSLQKEDINNRHPWFRSKSFDTFAPIGPWIVTKGEIRPPVHLAIECRVNGKIRQKANTRSLLFDIPTVIEFITRYITLEPGDIVSTGTPEGIGPIRHGDTMVCRIQNIGELRNPVRNR
jgi:5-oxopent-3-ene-1,2,5-tricarboxylate decarboxylase / 2-hydroxyhepta-2,4-diene-1,7-dioate isomerase